MCTSAKARGNPRALVSTRREAPLRLSRGAGRGILPTAGAISRAPGAGARRGSPGPKGSIGWHGVCLNERL